MKVAEAMMAAADDAVQRAGEYLSAASEVYGADKMALDGEYEDGSHFVVAFGRGETKAQAIACAAAALAEEGE